MSDSSYGIKNYQPNIMFDREGILRAYQGIEKHLRGQHLSRIWTVWSEQDANIWDHAPIVLEFGGFSHEMNWIQVEDLEISANTIDTSKDFNLYNFDEYPCHWKENAFPEIQAFVGQKLLSVDLLEAEAEGYLLKRRSEPLLGIAWHYLYIRWCCSLCLQCLR